MLFEPGEQLDDFPVGPHPGGPPLYLDEEVSSCCCRVEIALGEAVHLVAVGPVAFDGDEVKGVVLDELFCDACAPGVVLVGTVRGLAEHDNAGVSDALDEEVQVFCGL